MDTKYIYIYSERKRNSIVINIYIYTYTHVYIWQKSVSAFSANVIHTRTRTYNYYFSDTIYYALLQYSVQSNTQSSFILFFLLPSSLYYLHFLIFILFHFFRFVSFRFIQSNLFCQRHSSIYEFDAWCACVYTQIGISFATRQKLSYMHIEKCHWQCSTELEPMSSNNNPCWIERFVYVCVCSYFSPEIYWPSFLEKKTEKKPRREERSRVEKKWFSHFEYSNNIYMSIFMCIQFGRRHFYDLWCWKCVYTHNAKQFLYISYIYNSFCWLIPAVGSRRFSVRFYIGWYDDG